MDADLLVIGGGAGGLAAARTAARMGRRTILISDGPPGGDCTFTGCVPSKTLIEAAGQGLPFGAAMDRVRATIARIAATETADVLRGEGIDVVDGRASFTDRHCVVVADRRLSAQRIVVATGSGPITPPIPGLDEVAALTNENVWQLTDPPASLAIIGGGPIGCELAQAFIRYGITFTVVEAAGRLLPKEEPSAAALIAEVFKREGIDLRMAATVTRVDRRADDTITLSLDDRSQIDADRVLVAVGRRPATAGLNLPAAGVRVDDRGYIRTNRHLATTTAGIYAAGDVTGGLAFTHAADEMGRLAAVNALRWPARLRFHPESIPWVTFTDPEVARIGLTEAQAAGRHGRVAELPLDRVDRAVTAERTDGFIKLIAGPRRLTGNLAGGRLLGATIVAPRAGEMIHETALAIRAGVFTGRLAQTVHAYPTWSTGIRKTAAQFLFDVEGRRARPAIPD